MPNKYSYGDPLDDEDRELENDLFREQIRYYRSLADINNIFLKTLKSMNNDEIKNVLMNPVIRIK